MARELDEADDDVMPVECRSHWRCFDNLLSSFFYSLCCFRCRGSLVKWLKKLTSEFSLREIDLDEVNVSGKDSSVMFSAAESWRSLRKDAVRLNSYSRIVGER